LYLAILTALRHDLVARARFAARSRAATGPAVETGPRTIPRMDIAISCSATTAVLPSFNPRVQGHPEGGPAPARGPDFVDRIWAVSDRHGAGDADNLQQLYGEAPPRQAPEPTSRSMPDRTRAIEHLGPRRVVRRRTRSLLSDPANYHRARVSMARCNNAVAHDIRSCRGAECRASTAYTGSVHREDEPQRC